MFDRYGKQKRFNLIRNRSLSLSCQNGMTYRSGLSKPKILGETF